jgi:hypothetical protein
MIHLILAAATAFFPSPDHKIESTIQFGEEPCCTSFGWGGCVNVYLPSSAGGDIPTRVIVEAIFTGGDSVANFHISWCHPRGAVPEHAYLAPELLETHTLKPWDTPSECWAGWIGESTMHAQLNGGHLMTVEYSVQDWGMLTWEWAGCPDSVWVPNPEDPRIIGEAVAQERE